MHCWEEPACSLSMCAMLEISNNAHLKELGWRLLLQEQVDDEVILGGPTEVGEEARTIVVECMSKLFDGKKILNPCSRNYDCIEKSFKGNLSTAGLSILFVAAKSLQLQHGQFGHPSETTCPAYYSEV